MKKNKGNTLPTYLPYFGSFIIFLGMAHLIFYYSSFGISIINFLDLSEIITSFFDIIVIVAILFAFSIVQRILTNTKKESDERKAKAQDILEEPYFLKRLFKYFSYYSLALFNGLGMFIVFFIWHFFDMSITAQSYLIISISTVASLVFLIVSFEIEIKHKQFNSDKNAKQFTSLLLTGILFLGIVYSFTYNQIYSVKNHKLLKGVRVTLDNDSTLISDSSNYYIGKTKDYLFFYHQYQNRTDVFPIHRVKELTFEIQSDE